MIIPGPVVEKGIRKRENQYRQEADFVANIQVFKNGPESQPRQYINEGLGFYEGDHLGAENLEEHSRDHPVHIAYGHTEILIGHLSLGQTIGAFPGQKDIYPVRKTGHNGGKGYYEDDQDFSNEQEAFLHGYEFRMSGFGFRISATQPETPNPKLVTA
jgi:hypothetical protein